MGYLEQILLQIYFPQFHSPNKSRFESFFVSKIKTENENPLNKNIYKSLNISPEKIVRNEDKRTSIIIKGIPKNMPKKEVRSLIDKFGNINYLYIIKSPKDEHKNTSIAFVNYINYKSIIPLFMNLRNSKIEKNGEIFNIKILYSSVQGKEKIKEFIKRKYSGKF